MVAPNAASTESIGAEATSSFIKAYVNGFDAEKKSFMSLLAPSKSITVNNTHFGSRALQLQLRCALAPFLPSNQPIMSKEAHDDPSPKGTSTSNLDPAPDGGLRAWIVAIGGACIFFCCLGFTNAFGIFQEYYMTHQLRNESADRIAWIGSLAAFIQFAVGAIGGLLFDRFGAWVSILPQEVQEVFSHMTAPLIQLIGIVSPLER